MIICQLRVKQACFQCVCRTATDRDSGYLVSVLRLLVYMCPPTSMWTGAVVLVSLAGMGIPVDSWGDRDTSCWLDMQVPLWTSCVSWSDKKYKMTELHIRKLFLGNVIQFFSLPQLPFTQKFTFDIRFNLLPLRYENGHSQRQWE